MNHHIKQFTVISGLMILPCFGALQKPSDGQFINYINVLFEWTQEPNTSHYELQLSESESFDSILFSTQTNIPLYILNQDIDWEKIYHWRVRPFYQIQNPGSWIDTFMFRTMASKFPSTNVDIIQDEYIQNGFTIFGGAFPSLQSGIIDKFGNEIWNDGSGQFMLVHVNKYGNLYGLSSIDSPNNNGIRTNANLEFLWSAIDENVDFHEFKQMPNGNYMGFIDVDTLGPIPPNHEMTEQFQNLGFVADGMTNEFPWVGQKVVEWNENHEIVWSWNPFDHFSMSDYDIHGFTWIQAYQELVYDWTHANSFFFDKNENMLYISFRHLSRISKIDYETGNVIWNMGLPEPYMATGDEQICTELLFSFQHHIQKLENGNLLFLDNGNISDQLFGYDDPISRILEVNVIGDSVCNIIWEYTMPPNLFGTGSGSVQRLDNGNTLIYTAGNGLGEAECTIFEVTSDQNIIWKYVSEPNESWYRSFRIPSIHSSAFSVIIDNFKTIENDGNQIEGVLFSDSVNFISFQVHNQSGYDQNFHYNLTDSLGWFDLSANDTVFIEKGGTFEFFQIIDAINFSTFNKLQLIVSPIHHTEDKKVLQYMVYKTDNLLSTFNTPLKYKFNDPYPNPFNPEITFSFELLNKATIDINIYNIMGRKVKSFNQVPFGPGYCKLNWPAMDETGKIVSTGIYFYEIKIGREIKTGKIIYLK